MGESGSAEVEGEGFEEADRGAFEGFEGVFGCEGREVISKGTGVRFDRKELRVIAGQRKVRSVEVADRDDGSR